MRLLAPLPDEPLYRRVYRSLRDAIVSGDLPAGSRVPSTRRLADEWSVARNTVIEAVELLVTEGYLETRPASGTYVTMTTLAEPVGESDSPPIPLSAWARRALDVPVNSEPEGGRVDIDFRVGAVPTDLFPSEAWAEALAARVGVLRTGGYGDELGPLETREALCAFLARERGVHATPDMLMLTSGSQGSLDALARVFLEPGRTVAVEDPGYPGARRVFAATGATVHPVGVDHEGLDTAALPATASVAYVTPAHQFPTGAALPAGRRLDLIDWAARARAWIIEDDYNSEFRFDSRPLSALQGLAPHSVVYVGTFSKSLAPALRSGYLVAPPTLVRTLARARALTDRQPPTLDALALAGFLATGQYTRHVRRVRALAQERHETMLTELTRCLPGWRPRRSGAGLHLYVDLPDGLDETRVARLARARGVALSVGAAYSTRAQPPAVLLAFAHLPNDDIREGVQRLADALG